MGTDNPADQLRVALERLRDLGWLKSFTFHEGALQSAIWTDKGLANLALLRAISLQARLTEDADVTRAICWLAESFGPDMKRR